MKSLADVGFNPTEASILLNSITPVAVSSHAYSARRLFNLGLVKSVA